QRYPPTEDAKTFARSLAARLGGNIVILSPGFDSKPDGSTISNQIRTVGAEINTTLPRHRLGNHFGGSTPISATGTWNDYQDFHAESWLDFHLFQSGQAGGNSGEPPCNTSNQLQRFTNRARQIPLSLRTYSPRKGSVNAEAIYDDEGAVLIPGQTLPSNALYYVPYRVRQTAYLSTLSGAFGYTVGVYGLWDWGRGNDPYQPRTPKDSVGRASVTQMQVLGSIFRSQRWWWLAPTPAQIINNAADPTCQSQHLQMVVSRDLTRRSTMAYLPDNAAIQLQLTSTLYPSFTTTRWSKLFYNPRTGGSPVAVTPTLVSGTTDVYNFPRPSCSGSCNGQNGDRDWVLVLTDTTAGAPLWSPGPMANSLQTWSVYDPANRRWSIHGQIFDATGKPVTGDLALTRATKAEQRLPQSSRGNDGNFFVVWEAEGLDGDASGLFGRLIGASGAPLGKPFQVNSEGEGRQSEPIVTTDGLGRFLVVWTSAGPDTDGKDVMVRRFSARGEP
ncbi:MAG: DUF4038 domain-containing protein, partial [Acidobacteria bacterium]|nr:DUF4038 domain-containing protein [Acidobacteriota bacterium]